MTAISVRHKRTYENGSTCYFWVIPHESADFCISAVPYMIMDTPSHVEFLQKKIADATKWNTLEIVRIQVTTTHVIQSADGMPKDKIPN